MEATFSCTSRRGLRLRPQHLEPCEKVIERARIRDHFFTNLRGKAWAKTPDLTLDMELAVASPILARMEMTGALGTRVGLLSVNERWMQLYVLREKTVFRFPTAEARKDTLRRERFFRLLPLRVDPEWALAALLSHADLPESKDLHCRYDDQKNAYFFRIPEVRGGGRWLWLDPTHYLPLEAEYYAASLPEEGQVERRPELRVTWSQWVGQGASTLPSHIDFFALKKRVLAFEWVQAEVVPQLPEGIFDWQPPASIRVEDY